MLALRRPAPADFLARRVAAIRWIESEPGPRSRKMLAAICRAELEWAESDWRHRTGGVDGDAVRHYGPHPSEASRLPHEHAAAQLVNAHLHVDVERWRLSALGESLRRQRRAAFDDTKSTKERLAWADAAAGSLRDWRVHASRRRAAWQFFLVRARRYRDLRAQIDAAEPLAA